MNTSPRLSLAQIEVRVCDIASQCLNIPRAQVLLSSRLIEDLHCDSLDLFELVMDLEDEFAVTIPMERDSAFALKSIFLRQPFCLRDLAEVIYVQQGTGTPRGSHRGRRNDVPSEPVADVRPPAIPFTQLSGRWEGETVTLRRSLFEQVQTASAIPQFRRQTDGMRCLLIPQANVEIGSDGSGTGPDEQPQHTAWLDSFLIDAEPVSTVAYSRFLNSISPHEAHLRDWILLDPEDDRVAYMPIVKASGEWEPVKGTELLPMTLVSWFGANAYSLWANGCDWSDYRGDESYLPTEAQWEYAARGPKSLQFPWGEEAADPLRLRCAQHEQGLEYSAETLPMAAVNELLGMSPFGLHHMAGNVWQWCRDWYDENFYRLAAASQRNPMNLVKTGVRAERGGSWVGPAELCRSSYRRGRAPNARGRCLGFRCTSLPSQAGVNV